MNSAIIIDGDWENKEMGILGDGWMMDFWGLDGSTVEDVLEIALFEELSMPCVSVLRRIQLFELLVQLVKGPCLLIASTVLQPTLLSLVNLLLMLALLLFILLNLKPILYILLHSPRIFNGFSYGFRLY